MQQHRANPGSRPSCSGPPKACGPKPEPRSTRSWPHCSHGPAAAASSALGQSTFEAQFTAGTQHTRDAAIRLALGEPTHPPLGPPDDRPTPLSQREAEIARLVADGLTNKQIGTRLFISERTVENHVRNIMNKTGFNSRTQIAGLDRGPRPDGLRRGRQRDPRTGEAPAQRRITRQWRRSADEATHRNSQR